jgi:hypothetical protein
MTTLVALSAYAAEVPRPPRDIGSTLLRPSVPLDSKAMNAMLRADRDKDGTLSVEELEQYDLTLGPRFRQVDSDRDGRLTLYEFELLLEDPHPTTTSR